MRMVRDRTFCVMVVLNIDCVRCCRTVCFIYICRLQNFSATGDEQHLETEDEDVIAKGLHSK